MNTIDIPSLVQRLGHDADGLLFIKDEDWHIRQHRYGADIDPEDIKTARMLHKELSFLPNDHALVRGWVDRGFGVTVGLVRDHYIVSLDDCTDAPKWWRTLVFSSLTSAVAALIDDQYSLKRQMAADALPPYKEVPVSVAMDIARHFDKDQVIIVAWDTAHHRTHVTTYGKTPFERQQAAQGGNLVKKALGWPDELCHAEPEASPSDAQAKKTT
jgi:hypothetical protein